MGLCHVLFYHLELNPFRDCSHIFREFLDFWQYFLLWAENRHLVNVCSTTFGTTVGLWYLLFYHLKINYFKGANLVILVYAFLTFSSPLVAQEQHDDDGAFRAQQHIDGLFHALRVRAAA